VAGLKPDSKKRLMLWLKRLGWAGILFFTIKGLVWLTVFLGIGKLIGL